MAESTPPFKLFFGDEENTVQSFRLSREAPFSRFQELLGSLYPRYKAERDVLQYVGDEGKVSFRNDEEYEEMLVRCRDRSLVKLYIEGRIDKSEMAPTYWPGWHPYWYGYGPYYGAHPYWHDWHEWHWGGWGYNRKIYHALQNLWVGQSIYRGLPYWLNGAVHLMNDDDFDINVNALVTALKTQAAENMKSRDTDKLKEAKNCLATHIMIDSGNVESLYDLARIEARLGNNYAAFTWLKKAAKAGFSDLKQLKNEADLNPLHATYGDWEDVCNQVSANGGKRVVSKSFSDERFVFKFGQPDKCEQKAGSSSSSKAPAPKAVEPAKPKVEEKPAPKPAASGFLFALPGAAPEKPKEEPKPEPKPSGFLFALPGAPAPAPAEPKPVEKKPEAAPPAQEIPEDVKKYQTQLDVLHGMGFLDDSLLIGFLEKFKGNVDDVLSELLG